MNIRKDNGAALISVLVIGMFSIIFLLALAAIVTSAVRSTSANKWVEALRNAAEIGADYSINQFNSTYPCSLDPAPNAPPKTTDLPLSELQATGINGGTPTPGIPNVTVKIKVTQIQAASNWSYLQANSSIYSPTLDPNRSTTSPWAKPQTIFSGTSTGGFRVVESTATNGVYSRTIRVILKARFDPQPNGLGLPVIGSTTTQSYFNLPLFSNGALTIAPQGGPLSVQGINSQNALEPSIYTVNPGKPSQYTAYNLNVTSNTLSSISTGATILGDLNVLSNASGSNPVAFLPGGNVGGRLLTNGVQDSTVNAPPGNNPGGNVLANADIVNGSTSRSGLNNTNPAANISAQQNSVAPTPESTSSMLSLPSLSNLSGSSTPIKPGDWSTAGLDTTGVLSSSPVVIKNASAPVKIFVEDPGTGQAVYIDTSKLSIQSSDARNLQIYYEGTKGVTLNVGSNFNGLIYAPNAPVSIKGNGTFNGAMIGGSINATMTGIMNLYTDLAINSKTPPSAGPGSNWSPTDIQSAFNANQTSGLQYQLGPNGPVIQGWQPVTWQEFNPGSTN
jgi:hypothetical protein